MAGEDGTADPRRKRRAPQKPRSGSGGGLDAGGLVGSGLGSAGWDEAGSVLSEVRVFAAGPVEVGRGEGPAGAVRGVDRGVAGRGGPGADGAVSRVVFGSAGGGPGTSAVAASSEEGGPACSTAGARGASLSGPSASSSSARWGAPAAVDTAGSALGQKIAIAPAVSSTAAPAVQGHDAGRREDGCTVTVAGPALEMLEGSTEESVGEEGGTEGSEIGRAHV